MTEAKREVRCERGGCVLGYETEDREYPTICDAHIGDDPFDPKVLAELRKTQPEIIRIVPYAEVEEAGYEMELLGDGPFIALVSDYGRGPQEVWRFPEKPLARWMADRMIDSHDYHWMKRREENPCPNLNDMAVAFARGQFSLEEYMQFYRDIGCSLCGFIDVFGDRWDEAHGIKRCQKVYAEDEDGTALEVCGEPKNGPIHTDDWLDTGKPHHKFQGSEEEGEASE